MGIVDEDIARVRDQTDLVALVSEKVALKRVGQRFVGLCPFHQEKTPSFGVNPEMHLWHCFGCQKSGDAITWVRETEGLDFVDAVEDLARRAGITLRYDDRTRNRDRSRRERLVEAVAAAGAFYHRLLLEAPEGGTARKYLRGRGFDGDAARRFVLGWAPDDWDALAKHLQREKFSREDLTEAGLAFVNKANRLQDQFRARLIFPIYDARGDAVGFGGRSLDEQGPKYKNSPETSIYQKSRLLYGLNWAKTEIVARREVLICEGYTDVMAYALAGHPNAVATCGTALADEHAKMLKNLTRRVVLAYDADTAGQGAAERWYRWEQELDLEVRVADLPVGKDPGDLWRDDKPRLTASVENAEPFLQFRVDRVLATADLETIEGRARAAGIAAAIVAEHPSELVRDQYAVQLADRLDLAADGVRAQIARGGTPDASAHATRRDEPPPPEPDDYGTSAPVQVTPREADVLLWAIHEPKLVSDWLDESLFLDATARDAYTVLVESDDVPQAIEAAQGPAKRLLEELAVAEPIDTEGEENLRARLMVRIVEQPAKRLLAEMLKADDIRSMEVKPLVDQVVNARSDGWRNAEDAARQLVGWIVHDARPAPSSAEGERVEPEPVEQQA